MVTRDGCATCRAFPRTQATVRAAADEALGAVDLSLSAAAAVPVRTAAHVSEQDVGGLPLAWRGEKTVTDRLLLRLDKPTSGATLESTNASPGDTIGVKLQHVLQATTTTRTNYSTRSRCAAPWVQARHASSWST